MTTTYDQHYQTEDLFGSPYPELVHFFENYAPKRKLLDLGCGQGRNALTLAKLGYHVTGIDSSRVGINQMLQKAHSTNLIVKGIVGDIYSFENYADYDVVLFDSMFHFEKRDRKKETSLIKKACTLISSKSVICTCILDTGSKVKILKDTIRESGIAFEILNDSSLFYKFEDTETGHQSEMKYCMYIVRKK
ncbi:MAG: class I SAM-dependent methyltransferase [Bacteroidales bacterium]|nr:class I SAM-dependent methyltransferase [Bacteroidales bacterium]